VALIFLAIISAVTAFGTKTDAMYKYIADTIDAHL